MVENARQSSDPFLQILRNGARSNVKQYQGKQLWLWLSLTVLLDFGQFLVFPCSGMPMLSLAFGAAAFGSLVAIPLALVAISKDERRSSSGKVLWSLLALVGLSSIVCLAGFPMLLTHMCP